MTSGKDRWNKNVLRCHRNECRCNFALTQFCLNQDSFLLIAFCICTRFSLSRYFVLCWRLHSQSSKVAVIVMFQSFWKSSLYVNWCCVFLPYFISRCITVHVEHLNLFTAVAEPGILSDVTICWRRQEGWSVGKGCLPRPYYPPHYGGDWGGARGPCLLPSPHPGRGSILEHFTPLNRPKCVTGD